MIRFIVVALMSTVLSLVHAAPPAPSAGLEGWPEAAQQRQIELETRLLNSADPARLRQWHAVLAAEPHEAGSPGDLRVAEFIATSFEEMGLDVERHAFWAYLGTPVSATVELIAPERVTLPIKEGPVEGDPWSARADLLPGWNAYSGTGDVTAEVVYANYGTREDFEQLQRLGVRCTGRIVLARYGGNFRGYKAKYAEAAGAVGLIIFTDPADSGWGRGVSYPEGGFASPEYIQRGSINTAPYSGDVLTPDVEAAEHAPRLDPDAVGLPRIPVQPVGWGTAQRIMQHMTGATVPDGWQGGMPFRYRLTGGSDLRVRLQVEQQRRLIKTFNIVGTLRGRAAPHHMVVVGCHHDAWGFGAGDPTCGLITVMESARILSDAARAGHAPERSIAFAAWGAEEHGIVGSVEWVEAHLDAVRRGAVAYVNLDMAAMGMNFGASASPSLQHCVTGVTQRVPLGDDSSEPVLSSWLQRNQHDNDPMLPRFGSLGGGSDHVGFIALAGVPCISMGAHGAPGTSYHSIYDNLEWYRRVVGDDYESARLVTRVAALTAARLANSPVVPVRAAWCGAETHRHLVDLTRRGRANGLFAAGDDAVTVELVRVAAAARRLQHHATLMQDRLDDVLHRAALSTEQRARIDDLLLQVDRAWLDARGLPGRPWFRNLYAAPDEDSGYASWLLPALRRAVDRADAAALAVEEQRYLAVFERLEAIVREIQEAIGPQTASPPASAAGSSTS